MWLKLQPQNRHHSFSGQAVESKVKSFVDVLAKSIIRVVCNHKIFLVPNMRRYNRVIERKMAFENEYEMKETAAESLDSEIRDGDIEYIPEFNYGLGRTDLVFIDISEPYWDHRIERLDLTEPIREKNHLISFLHLHGREPVTEDYFFDIGALKRRYKRESLSWLKKNGYITTVEDGKIRTAQNLRKHITTTIAVELKLKKWKKALRQANRGRSFAEYRYVVLDADHVDPAIENIDLFEDENIGLISIDEDGYCYTHFEPERAEPHNDFYQWKLNEQSIGINEV